MTGPDWVHLPARVPDGAARAAAAARLDGLTKPRGALGTLEGLVCHLAALQGTPTPALERVHITVFAADHGVTRHGVSAYPPEVTAQMVRNFSAGGAAINVLARALGAALEVVDLGTATDPGPLPGVISTRLGPGSADFTAGAALTPAQLAGALAAGRDAVTRAARAQAFIGGEMGIGNTTAAAALGCALLALPAATLCGPGTGLDAAGVTRKAQVVARALTLHAGTLADPCEALRRVGGLEIAALAGAYIAAAQRGLPVLLDGFICAAAALAAARINPGIAPWLLPMHRSAEPGHDALLAALPAARSGHALLDLGLRLGEGTGAATAVPLARLACALNAGMASFGQAGVDTAIEGDAPDAPATAHGAARTLPSGSAPLPANGSVPNVEPDLPSGAGMDPARTLASDTAASAGTDAVPHARADRAPTDLPHAAPATPPRPTPAAAGGPGANVASAGASADTPGTGRPASAASAASAAGKSSSA